MGIIKGMVGSAAVLQFSAGIRASKLVMAQGEIAVEMPEIISALSFALDLTEGAVPGHAMRTCVLGMRIAIELGLPEAEMRDLYYALLLKDVGCSSNAARMCQIVGGDDRAIKAGVKLEDWTKPHQPKLSVLRLMWANVLPEASAAARVARIAKIALTQHKHNEEMITLRCDRGASIVRKIGLSEGTAGAVRSLDEHWDGSGYPERLRGTDIPMLARIAAVAQHLDVFASETTTGNAMAVLQDRNRKWFDPELVRIAELLHQQQTLWQDCMASTPEHAIRNAVFALEPNYAANDSESQAHREGGHRLDASQIDRICEAFSDVVDAKSPFSYRHSLGVAEVAVAIAETLGLSAQRIQLVRRAALLHDLGKLRVPNSILDKQGKLTDEEFRIIKEHPDLTFQILSRIGSFQGIALIAGEHHEKLDGTGYPHCKVASELSLEARIVAVADVYTALSEERPYRPSLDFGQIQEIMARDVPHKLDAECYEALRVALSRSQLSAS